MQNSVTQAMSWVTRTMPLAAFVSSMIRCLLFARKTASPVDRTSSMIRTSGSTAVAIEKPSRARIPDEYVLIGASMNSPMSANSTIPGRRSLHLAVMDAEERARQADVVAAGQVLVEPGSERQQARNVRR